MVRHIVLDEAAALNSPAVRALMKAAIKRCSAGTIPVKKGQPRMVIKSISAQIATPKAAGGEMRPRHLYYTLRMNLSRFAATLAFVGVIGAIPAVRATQAQGPSKIDATFDRFWAAHSPADAEARAGEIVKAGVTFDDALRRLKAGRPYSTQKTGVFTLSNRTTDQMDHFFSVNIPEKYDPAKRYQVRFQLHGGIGGRTDNQPRGNGSIGQLAGAEQIYVLPYAWNDDPWWSDDQVLNIESILDSLKRSYNIDENRVVLSGVSDGGTGAYYIAMRNTTPFASFLPLNGFIMVLSNDEMDDGGLFPNNLRNKPMFVVNGGRDPLYPMYMVEPYVKHLMRSVDISYNPQPEAAHNTAWWPQVKDTFEKFVTDHPRDPDPDKLTWETAFSTHSRAHWLIIDKLGAQSGDATDLVDINTINDPGPISDFAHIQMFNRTKPSGRVDLVRTGNTIQAKTQGVAAFSLLLSPDKFDFSKPVKVVVNGRERFNGKVERSLETLLNWAAADNDRTMLYAAELQINLAR